MRKLKRLTLGALLAFLLVSCQSYKKVPYLQDTAFVNDTEQSVRQTGVKVMPKDLLTIAVSCSTPELAAPFNLVNSGTASGMEGKTVGQGTASSALQQYLVDNQVFYFQFSQSTYMNLTQYWKVDIPLIIYQILL